jgi:hypothetical protein
MQLSPSRNCVFVPRRSHLAQNSESEGKVATHLDGRESAVRVHPSHPVPLILHIQYRARVPFHYWPSFSQRWPWVCCVRVGRLGPTLHLLDLSPIMGVKAVLRLALP